MSSRIHPLFTVKNNCQDCYKCVRRCPVKAIKIEDNSAQIVPELCVACGTCYKVCPVRAKQDRDDVTRAKNMLATGEKIYVSLAPSWIAEFDNVTKEQLLTAIEKLGFSGVSETAVGAEEVSAHLADFLSDKTNGIYLSTACPSFVEYINKYMPELTENLTPVVSPLLAHCKLMREKLGKNIKIVFVHLEIMLCIGDRALEELNEILRCVLAGVFEYCHRHIRILASDKVKYNLNFSR